MNEKEKIKKFNATKEGKTIQKGYIAFTILLIIDGIILLFLTITESTSEEIKLILYASLTAFAIIASYLIGIRDGAIGKYKTKKKN